MGRGALFMVMGFNVVFLSIGFNISRVSTNAYENYIDYYERTTAHKIASSAANMACGEISFAPNWRTGYSNVAFLGGTFNVGVTDEDSGRIRITSRSTYGTVNATVSILLGQSSFSKFAYYSQVEGSIYWISGDTVQGPMHTQDRLRVSGKPVFYGKVTAKKGLYKNPSSSKPKFLGGFQQGVSIDMPANLNPLITAAQSGGAFFDNQNVWLEFHADGDVTYRIGSPGAAPTKVPITTFAPNGAILAKNANLHIKGVLNGKVTIAATGTSGGDGRVWLDSSVTYAANPETGPSDDMLGIVADREIYITDNADNKDFTLHGTAFSRTAGLTAQNYASRAKGTFNLLGGLQQYQRGPVGTFGGGGIVSGFQKNYRYDTRMLIQRPPLFPTTGSYEVLSWYE